MSAATSRGPQPDLSQRERTFARPGSDLKIDIEIYVTRMHAVGENKYVYSMVSNAIRMGNPGAAPRVTFSRYSAFDSR